MRELAERVMRVASGLGPRYEIHQPTLAKIEAMLVEGVIEQGVVEAVNEQQIRAAFLAGWKAGWIDGEYDGFDGVGGRSLPKMEEAVEHYLRTLRPATVESS